MFGRIVALLLLCLIYAMPAYATRERVNGWCQDGGIEVDVPGTTGSGTQRFQQSFRSCTVTVYAAGTTTLSTLYSDAAGTSQANPFTATNLGRWFFYADGGRYDIRFSAGGISTPFTLGDFRVPNEVFNVTDYGALCDGTTNDYTAVNRARIAATALTNGGVVLFPSSVTGTCIINTSITFDADITVVFEGGAQISQATATTFTVSGTLIAPVRQIFAGAGTKTISSAQELWVDWWGIVSEDGNDDSDAFQAAFNSAFAAGRGTGVRFGPGEYDIDTRLDASFWNGISFKGAGSKRSILQWDSASTTTPLLQLCDVRDSYFSGFRIAVETARTLNVGITVRDLGADPNDCPGTGTNSTSTNNGFEDIFIHPNSDGSGGGAMTNCFNISESGDPNQNNDFHHLVNVRCADVTTDAFTIRNSQSKHIVFEDCTVGGLSGSRYGVNLVAGSFKWYRGSIQGLNASDAANFMIQAQDELILIEGVDSTVGNNERFLDTTGSASHHPTVVMNNLAEKTTAGAGPTFIRFQNNGPLILIGNVFRSGVGDLAVNAPGNTPDLVAFGNHIVRTGDQIFWTGTWGQVSVCSNFTGASGALTDAHCQFGNAISFADQAVNRPATGFIRMANTEIIRARNAANTDNFVIAEATSGNLVQIGENSSGVDAYVGANLVGEFDATGLRLRAMTNATLGTPTNGIMSYCSDCTVTGGADNTCTGGGGGALAVRLAGVWRCFNAQN